MKSVDAWAHSRGETGYVDDVPVAEGSLYAVVYGSPLAHGTLAAIDTTAALATPGVVAVLTAEDIPGENQIGGIVPDEPLLAEGSVDFQGQPIALVVAAGEAAARLAVARLSATIEALPVVTDPREARRLGELIVPPRTFGCGDVDAAWPRCTHLFEGTASTGGQEHLYIETQGAYAEPAQGGAIRIHSSTQGPTAVQRTAARVLGVPMHQIEVEVSRLGGGFGGKEDQATPWAVLAALGAYRLQRGVRLILSRADDLRMTGKRHPYTSDFKIGLDAQYRILAYEVVFHQNAGAAADLSPAVLERTLFHTTNGYYVPNVRATAYSCRTHLPPNTAFRGFGGPQAMFVIESAIALAAERLGVDADVIQRRNLIRDGESFCYGQTAEAPQAVASWERCAERYDLDGLKAEVASFNATNGRYRRGLAVMPICFGISFTKTHMNQAAALVHIYQDGSAGISTAAVEMGQGVHTKLVQVAARSLAVRPERLRIENTNTTRVANTSPTAASSSADLNGKALESACRELYRRLVEVAAGRLEATPERVELRDELVYLDGRPTGVRWPDLVQSAHLSRIDLSAHAFYATPRIHFDPEIEEGHPFAYHVYGTAIVLATVDALRGTYTIDAVRLVHDSGSTLNPVVDRGQIEGGVVQGVGWMTLEEVLYDDEGRLLTNALSTYKVPDVYGAPREIDIELLAGEATPQAICGSKAVGEPPLMYGIGAFFALRNAMRAAQPKLEIPFCSPMTPERVLLSLFPDPEPTGTLSAARTETGAPVPDLGR